MSLGIGRISRRGLWVGQGWRDGDFLDHRLSECLCFPLHLKCEGQCMV